MPIMRSASSTGAFSFDNLAAGSYHIRVVQVGGFTRTTPVSGVFNLTVSNGSDLSSINFGQKSA